MQFYGHPRQGQQIMSVKEKSIMGGEWKENGTHLLILGILAHQKKGMVKKMLFEESDVFAQEEGDIGCIPDLENQITPQFRDVIMPFQNPFIRR